jgi:alpha-glucosidase
MQTIPIFARGGSVIPMWPDAPPSTSGYHPLVIELHLFVPAVDSTHTSLLQEDDGLTFASLEGSRYRTTLEVTRVGDRLTMRGDVAGEGYEGFAREELHLVIHGAAPDAVEVDGTRVPVVGGRVTLLNRGTSLSIALDLKSGPSQTPVMATT